VDVACVTLGKEKKTHIWEVLLRDIILEIPWTEPSLSSVASLSLEPLQNFHRKLLLVSDTVSDQTILIELRSLAEFTANENDIYSVKKEGY
jgi:hypothetical protein